MEEHGKIISCKVNPGGSIGPHSQQSSDDVNYVVLGFWKTICDGMVEFLVTGWCHICPNDSEYRIINTGGSDLVLLRLLSSGNIYNAVNY